ncbi:hypothetical protein COU58_04145 [Candidatus Pacearchaeota archaeon CG10_big_fil_rev_8_21_14_0_10_32_42]|nr:MAG: hypothetical protein COU58_04145 [Candidatus Pacearchaeota archaeon CG10_big_fil_rev_8_21_14_0_10_32_42]
MNLEDYLPQSKAERKIYEKILAGKEISKEEAYFIGEDGDKHGDFPYKYTFTKDDAIGINGNCSFVFSVTPKKLELVVKIPKDPKNWWKVQRGAGMQSKAHELGVKVARPEGIYKVLNLENKKFYSGLVMEHLGMLPINEIRSLKEQICDNSVKFDFDYNGLLEKLRDSCLELNELHRTALKRYEILKQEAELKGFDNIDYRETNAFWVPSVDDIRMIDCDEWNYYDLK